jgi:hypothetical protein
MHISDNATLDTRHIAFPLNLVHPLTTHQHSLAKSSLVIRFIQRTKETNCNLVDQEIETTRDDLGERSNLRVQKTRQ